MKHSKKPNGKNDQASVFTSGREILDRPEVNRHFLIDDILPGGIIALLTGPSDVGKSIFARQIAVSAALGRKYVAGFPLNARFNRAIYITTEDGIADWKEKLEKYNLSASDKELLDNLQVVFDYEKVDDDS